MGTSVALFIHLFEISDQLIKQQYLDKSLQLTKPHYFLVINGDVAHGSPYILETLTLIMVLMQKNPQQVFFLRGHYEDKEGWWDTCLAKELKYKASSVSEETIPLSKLIGRFFDTLPLALYLVNNTSTTPKELVRISSWGKELPELDEENFSQFFIDTTAGLTTLKLTEKPTGKSPVALKALIKNAPIETEASKTTGLKAETNKNGFIIWTILSSPTGENRRLYQFFYDAFVILSTKNSIASWTLKLCNQDTRNGTGFICGKSLNLLTAQAVKEEAKKIIECPEVVQLKQQLAETQQEIERLKNEQKITPEATPTKKPITREPEPVISKISLTEDLVFGSTCDLSKSIRDEGRLSQAGLQLVFDEFNASGGFNNKKIVLQSCDDEYNPEKTLTCINQFLKNNINKFIAPLGSATTKEYLPFMRENKAWVFFPISGSNDFRKPELKNMIHWRASVFDEAQELVHYFVKLAGKNLKFACLYQDDIYGISCLNGARKALKEAGIESLIEISYKANDSNLSSQANKLLESKFNVLLLFSTSFMSINFLRNVGATTLTNKFIGCVSNAASTTAKRFMKSENLNFISSNVVPNPETSTIQIAKEFRQSAAKHDSSVGTFTLEGYISGALIIELIKKAGSSDPTKIIEAAQNINNLDFKGLKLNFNPEDRVLMHTIWLDTGKPEWEEIDIAPSAPTTGEIVLATTRDLSKAMREEGRGSLLAIKYFFEQVNKAGGLNNKMISLRTCDDEYDPAKTLNCIKPFLKDNLNLFIAPLGSPTTAEYLPFVEEKKAFLLFPATGSLDFRKPELTYILNWRAAGYDEAQILVRHFLRNEKQPQFACFYQNDNFGLSCLAGAKKALKDAGIESIKEISYRANDPNLEKQVKELLATEFDVLLLFATPIITVNFLRQVGTRALTKKLLGCDDTSGSTFVRQYAANENLNFIVTNVVPNPQTSNLLIVKEFRELAAKYAIPLEPFALEGYIDAALTFALFLKAKNITPTDIIEVAEKVKNVDFKGLKLNFNPQDRSFMHKIWLNTGKSEWEEIDSLAPAMPSPLPLTPSMPPEALSVPTGNKITLGTTRDLSKTAREEGKSSLLGLQIAFDEFNKAGGLNNKKIILESCDDEYTPAKTLTCINEFLEKKINFFIAPLGSPTTLQYLPLVKEKKCFVLFPRTSSMDFRKPELTHIINWRASIPDQVQTLVRYFLKQEKSPKFACLYQDDNFGKNCLLAAKNVLNQAGIESLKEIRYKANDPNLEHQAKELSKTDFDVLLLFATPSIMVNFLRQVGTTILAKKQLGGIDDASSSRVQKFIKNENLNLTVTNIVPNPQTSNLPIVKEFRAFAEKKEIPIEPFSLGGYFDGSLAIELISKAKSINPANIIATAENLKAVDFKGLKLNFDPQDRTIMHTVWLNTGNPEWEEIDLTPEISKHVPSISAPTPSVPPVTEITLGTTRDLSKTVREEGRTSLSGMNLFIDELNKSGGILNKKIILQPCDDEYTPEKTTKCIDQFLKNNINLFLAPLGSPTTRAYIPFVEEKKVLVLFPAASSSYFRKPELTNIINWRSSGYDQAQVLVRHFVQQGGKNLKFAVLYQDDDFGINCLNGAKNAIKEAGIESLKEISYTAKDTNLSKQINELLKTNFDVLLMFSTPPITVTFLRQIGAAALVHKKIGGDDDSASSMVQQFVKSENINLTVANIVPNPQTSNLPIVKEFRQLAEKKDMPKETFYLEGYFDAALAVEIFKRAKSFEPADIITTAENLKAIDFKGLKLNFDPQDRTIMHTVWLNTGKPEWEEITLETSLPTATDVTLKKEATLGAPAKIESKKPAITEPPATKEISTKVSPIIAFSSENKNGLNNIT